MNSQHQRSRQRGFTLTEAVLVVGCGAILLAMGLPAFQRVGCNSMREQSKANLAQLSAAHTAYAADWSGRQYTLVPDDLGAFGGSFAQWQDSNGCAPRALLGENSEGVAFEVGTVCDGAGTFVSEQWLVPMDFASGGGAGAYRIANARLVNVYVDGRFYDETFYAPDDPLVTSELRKVQRAGGDFELLEEGLIESTYAYSPAAMFDPRVFGFGANPPSYRNPNTSSVLMGEGYRSPSVAQCAHPALKTRLMEMWAIENPPAPCNPSLPGCTPYMWNQSTFSRPLAAFFDGSVRIFTPRETMYAEDRANQALWVRNTPFGPNGFGGAQAADYLVKTSVHFFTSFGIAGRDTLATQ
ncbi:MAG: type II secretion system protein [Planctomycetota bacterium]